MGIGTKLTPTLCAFIERQPVFFVATAAPDVRVNVSPKGMSTLRILGDTHIRWLNLSGSGNETAAHLRASNRMTLMFCAFEGDPMILRIYGQATTSHPRDPDWARCDVTAGESAWRASHCAWWPRPRALSAAPPGHLAPGHALASAGTGPELRRRERNGADRGPVGASGTSPAMGRGESRRVPGVAPAGAMQPARVEWSPCYCCPNSVAAGASLFGCGRARRIRAAS